MSNEYELNAIKSELKETNKLLIAILEELKLQRQIAVDISEGKRGLNAICSRRSSAVNTQYIPRDEYQTTLNKKD